MRLIPGFLAALALGAFAVPAFAATPAAATKPPPATAPVPPERAVATRHSVSADGRTIHYTATAGTLLLRNKDHEPIGSMFYIAYTEDGAKADRRPVTFAYNGGPGAASALVDIGGFGPVRVAWPAPGDVQAAQPPYRLEPNAATILASTDLVFVDAMGTGYSRIVGKGKPKDFYGVTADASAFTQFIQRYLGTTHRWNSPKFLLGESYGTTRSAVLANDLVDAGVNLNGVILCSSGLNFLAIDNAPGNDLPYVSYLPSYAAIAWYHHRLNPMPPDLPAFVRQVEQFAGTTYARALFQGSALPDAEKRSLATQLAGYTGLPASLWLKADLRVPLSVFRRNVMGDDTMTGRYDERFTNFMLEPLMTFPGRDNIGPTSVAFMGGLTAGMNRYLAEDLKYISSHTYRQLSTTAFKDWDWSYDPPLGHEDMGFGAGSRTCCGTNVAPALARAMTNDPAIQLMVNNGYFDTATPFFGTDYALRHMGLPAALESHIHEFEYPVGHMLYLDPKVLPDVAHNIDTFIRGASGG